MKNKPIAVIGGTGKSGQYLVRELLRQSYSLRLLLRHPQHFTLQHPGLEVVTGDARNEADIHALVAGCEAVISTLGQPKGEPAIFSTATGHVLKAMQMHAVGRYVVTTGLQVNTPGDQKDAKTQAATEWMYAHFPETTQDKQREYELLQQSERHWTLVRLPLIIQTEEHFPMDVQLENCQGERISAADLAVFLVSQLKDQRYSRKCPFVYNV